MSIEMYAGKAAWAGCNPASETERCPQKRKPGECVYFPGSPVR